MAYIIWRDGMEVVENDPDEIARAVAGLRMRRIYKYYVSETDFKFDPNDDDYNKRLVTPVKFSRTRTKKRKRSFGEYFSLTVLVSIASVLVFLWLLKRFNWFSFGEQAHTFFVIFALAVYASLINVLQKI